MILSTTTSDLLNKHGVADAIRLIAKAGFDAYDYSFCGLPKDDPFYSDAYMENAKEIRALSEEIGISCNQAHAPFPSSVGDPEKDEMIFNEIVKSMEFAACLGAHVIVVHPKQHLCYQEHVDELFEMNVEFYSRLMPYAEKFGIKVATENMWQWNRFTRQCIHSTCSRAEEFCDYIDSIGSEWIVACLDIGHVVLVSEDIPRMIKMLGNRLEALHIHDNDYKDDLHAFPFFHQIDFDKMTQALTEIGYKGDFTFEIGGIYRKLPKETWESATKLLVDSGRYLMKKIG